MTYVFRAQIDRLTRGRDKAMSSKAAKKTAIVQAEGFDEAMKASEAAGPVATEGSKPASISLPVPSPAPLNLQPKARDPEVEKGIKFFRAFSAAHFREIVEAVNEERAEEQRAKVEKARAELAALEAGLAELEGTDWSEGSNPAPKKAGGKKTRAPRAATGSLPELDTVLPFIKAKGPTAAGDIMGKFGLSKSQYIRLAAQLKASPKVKHTGERKNFRWLVKA